MLGLFHRKHCWLPTWRGWLVLFVAYLALLVAAARLAHPFLAPNAPLRGTVLVVEGWLPDYALEEAAEQFRQNHYTRLCVTGGPIEKGGVLSEYKTYAALGAATLIQLGLDGHAVLAVPAPPVRKDRTYASAVALREWFQQHGGAPASFDLLSEGPHSRRSRLLFQKAFAGTSRVGIISVISLDYDASRWWKYSAGVRNVIGEFLGYCYVVLFFNEANG
jgi:hypothetical protein